jgi:hypothetical protein
LLLLFVVTSRSNAYRNASREPKRPTAARSLSKSDTPSSRHTTPSPSIVTDLTRSVDQRLCDCRDAVGVVVAAPGEHAHALPLAPADEPEAVVLDFVSPLRPGRRGMAERRKARLNEAGRATSRSGRAPEHGAYIAAAGIASREWPRQPFANHVELSNQPITPFDEACTWNRFWSNASVSGRMRFGTRLGDPKGLPSCTGLLRSERFSLPLLDRWPKRSESPFRANRLVARNPLRRELARQRDISYGPSGTWNRGAAFRISEMSGQSHPPSPPCLAG